MTANAPAHKPPRPRKRAGRRRASTGPRRGGDGAQASALCDELRSVTAPKQLRSEQTLARILEAAERLILERGIENVAVSDIVRAAGSSVGGFYGRFRDKEELLVALSERSQLLFRDEIASLLDPERWAGEPLAVIVRACAAALVAHVVRRRRLQAAFLHSVAVRPERWVAGVAFRQRITEGVAALLLTRRDEIRHPEPEVAARFAVETVFALMDQRALFAHVEGTWQLVEARLVDEITRLVVGYLGAQPPASPPERS